MMKRRYVKVLSVASTIAWLCAANASYAADEVAVTPAGAVDVQSDWNEDVPRHRDPAKNPALDPNFDLVSEVNKVDLDFMATVEARYSLYDQTRDQNFDFLNQLALFGVHLYKDNWTADLLVRFAGNYKRTSDLALVDTTSSFNVKTGTPIPVDMMGFVGIRKASIGYKLYRSNHHLLKFTLGRFAPYGATAYDDDNIVRAWGTDATVNLWGPNGSGNLHGIYVDGASLSWQGKWRHHRINMEATVASDLPAFLYTLTAPVAGSTTPHFNVDLLPYQTFGNDSSFGHRSTNSSRAWLVDTAYMYSGKWGDVQFAVDAGGKTNAETGFVLDPVTGATEAAATDMYYVAGSLGYTMQDKWAIGAWYNWTHVGDMEAGTLGGGSNDAVYQYNTASVGPTAHETEGNYSVFGIGMNGSSKWWKQNNIGGKGGVITFGGGYQRFMQRDAFYSDLTPAHATSSTDVNMYSLALGWARGPVTIEADWSLFTAKDKVFYRGAEHEANTADRKSVV